MGEIKKSIKVLVVMFVFCMILWGLMVPVKGKEHTLNVGSQNITCDENNDIYYISGSSRNNNITVNGKNITIYLNNVNIDLSADGYKEKAAINIKGNSTVTIYLGGSNYLKGGKHTGIGKNYGYAGIYVSKNSTVTILGNGELTAVGGGGDRGAAGIGGNAADDAGKIVIGDETYSPVIKATGASGGTGIGAGYEADAVKGIYIYNGTITATGGSEAAGIGGGRESYVKDIAVANGTIVAKGGTYGAGIGGGNAVNLGNGGNVDGIKIMGGNITATGGKGAAGVGGGEESEVSNLKIEEETEGSLNLIATGGENGAGIGSGNANISTIYIKLNKGKITATGGSYGAGIGTGNGTFDKIEIYGAGTIVATGYKYSCGIGSGGSEDGGKIIIAGNAEIRSLNITANAWWQPNPVNNASNEAAAIGSSDSGCGNIKISNATISLSSFAYGSGIGNGKQSSVINAGGMDITIDNCYIVDREGIYRKGAGIGAGWNSKVNNITITNSTYIGGNIGGSNCHNDTFEKNTINSIYISNSTIEATNKEGQKAAIGSGPHGAISSITIIDSDINAKTVSGAAIGTAGYSESQTKLKYTGGSCKSIYISGSKIVAEAGDGGAGIGGGVGTSVGTITIEDCPSVTAIGGTRLRGGAGIGGGALESCGDIVIKNSNLVKVEGKIYAAGIGSGGDDTAKAIAWDVKCGSIDIINSTVNVTGGEGSAGIGTGIGAQFESDAYITITDSVVISNGGTHGAGIGAGDNGRDGALKRGGEANIPITINGKSKVVATGGTGAAGIGGGYGGGADTVKIDLYETTYKNGDWLYYVKAYGGDGAAGIGTGGVYEHDNAVVRRSGSDIECVVVKGGYVYAKGGDDKDDRGAAAGIGGGARGGNLKQLQVSGGYIEAHAGYSSYDNDANADIGTGGEDVRPLQEDKHFLITGGTIIGTLSPDPEIIIDGGSISHRISKAKNKNGTKVYQTTLELEEGVHVKLTNMTTSVVGYGNCDILSDANKRVYLYMPLSAEKSAKADFKVDSKYQNYYGTTTGDGKGWLKKDYKIYIVGLSRDICVGDEFERAVSGADIGGEVIFTISGSAYILDDNNNKVTTLTQDVNKRVTLYGETLGDFTLKAKVDYASNVYWDGEASKTETIKQILGTVEIIEDPSKVYDGTPIENPGISTNSDGVVRYNYAKYISEYDMYTEPVEGMPTETGKYKVWVSVSRTDKFSKAVSSDMDFYISKRPVTLSLTAKENGVGATVIIQVSGLTESISQLGAVRLDYVDYTGTPQSVTSEVVKNLDGTYSAIAEFPTVASGEHTITATYVEHNKNYVCEPVVQSFDKSKEYREIVFGDIGEKYYGDNAFILPVSPEAGTSTSNDIWTFEVMDYYTNLPEAVTVNTAGLVTIENAGTAVVKVTLTDSNNIYAPSVGYVTFSIKPKEVTVKSYVYHKDDITKTPVTKAKYGTLTELEYGLSYSTINDADISNYSKSIVTLKPVPLTESTSVGSYRIEINKVAKDNATLTVDPFMSRNYKVTYEYGELEVTRAQLIIHAEDVTMPYGSEPVYTYHYEGLMAWDEAVSAPVITIDTSMTDGMEAKYLKPGIYTDVIKVSGADSMGNYTVIYGDRGTLTITKKDIVINLNVEDKVYDKTPTNVNVWIEQIVAGEPYDGKLVYTFYQITEEGILQLSDEPVNAGTYLVKVNAVDSDLYNDTLSRKLFKISKAIPNVVTPVLEDILMKDGLKLSEQQLPQGWSWIYPDAELSVGYVMAPAIYTPEDTHNYYTVISDISFYVYEEEAPSEEDSSEENPPETGDSSGIILLMIILLLSGAGLVVTIKKR